MSKEPERAAAGKSIAKPGRMMRPDECTVVVRVGSVRLVGLFDILCALRYHPEHVVAKGWALPGDDLFNPPRSFSAHVWAVADLNLDDRGQLYAILPDGSRIVGIELFEPDPADGPDPQQGELPLEEPENILEQEIRQQLVLRLKQSIHSVMAGLVPAIHELLRTACRFSWMPGTRPGMTAKLIMKSEH